VRREKAERGRGREWHVGVARGKNWVYGGLFQHLLELGEFFSLWQGGGGDDDGDDEWVWLGMGLGLSCFDSFCIAVQGVRG
jgi:hypothetical protein